LESLEQKLNNAPTQTMKEKYEMEMKKEIKKLQRIRDYFRAAINNPDIKDKSKPQEARRRVEVVNSRIRKAKLAK
jgi:CCR4-NOT transcription complex subunit 3